MENENSGKENMLGHFGLKIVGIKSSDEIIFDNLEPKIVLTDILQPVVKVENCTWLEEM